MNDVPLIMNGYAPENYDQKFNGYVTVEYALEHSLNIPAVKSLRIAWAKINWSKNFPLVILNKYKKTEQTGIINDTWVDVVQHWKNLPVCFLHLQIMVFIFLLLTR